MTLHYSDRRPASRRSVIALALEISETKTFRAVTCQNGIVLDGHHRIEAAKLLGLTHIPVQKIVHAEPSLSNIAGLHLRKIALKEGVNPGVKTFVSPKSELNLPTDTDREPDSAAPLPGSASPGGAGRDIPSVSYNTPDSGSNIGPRTSGLPGDEYGSPTKFDYGTPTRRSMTGMTARIVLAWEAGLPASTHQKNQDPQKKLHDQKAYKKNKSREKTEANRRYDVFCKHNTKCQKKREEYQKAPNKYKRRGISHPKTAFCFDADNLEETDLLNYPDEIHYDDLDEHHQVEIDHYEPDVVGNNAARAVEIARKQEEGFGNLLNICELSPSVCHKNKGLTRDKMPQIEDSHSVKDLLASDDQFKKAKAQAIVSCGGSKTGSKTILELFLEYLEEQGVLIQEDTVPVGDLKATQAEIKADKTLGMADNHLKGEFPGLTDHIVISADDFILDGHHRWAALLTIDPSRTMSVRRVGLTMDALLEEATNFPGVYTATFEGDPIIRKTAYQHKSRGMARVKARAYYQKHKTHIKAQAKVWSRTHKSQIKRTQKIYNRNPSSHHRRADELVSDLTIDFTIGSNNFPAVVDDITDTGVVEFTIDFGEETDYFTLPYDIFVEIVVFNTLDDRELFLNLLDVALSPPEDVSKMAAELMLYDQQSPANNEIKQPGDDVGYKAEGPTTYSSAPDEKLGVPAGHDIPHGHADQMSPSSARVLPGGEGMVGESYLKSAATIAEILSQTDTGLLARAKAIPIKLSRVAPSKDAWVFKATGSKGDSYTVKVKAKAPKTIKDVGKAQIQVSCNCNFFQFQGPEYWAVTQGYLLGKPAGTATKPDVKDPKGKNRLCKHAIAVLEKARTYRLASNGSSFWSSNATLILDSHQ